MSQHNQKREVILIGYSGHGFVAADIFKSAGYRIIGYCDTDKKDFNPFSLDYLGSEKNDDAIQLLKQHAYFIAVGDNNIRRKIYESLISVTKPLKAIHPSAVMSASAIIKDGVFIAASAIINPLVQLGTGDICNTSCSIDHECIIGDFAHIGPVAVLCGNVSVGELSFVGAGSVVKQGISIGKNVTIGAGAVIVKNGPENSVRIGNPLKQLTK